MAAPAPLDPEAFESVLRLLDADRERAGACYELLRAKLVKFFEWRGARFPEDLADETIDRVGRRLAGGERIEAPNPAVYFLGVARNVLRESWQRQHRAPETGDPLPERAAAQDDEDEIKTAARFACLERCLEELPPETRALILSYYAYGKAKRNRSALAEGLGIRLNALRIRMHRLRARLERCVARCLDRSGETEPPARPPSDGEVSG